MKRILLKQWLSFSVLTKREELNMKTETQNPASPIYKQLDNHVHSIKNLLSQLEPVQRLNFINEIMVKLLPINKSKDSATDKLNRKFNSSAELSTEERIMIEELGRKTEELYRSMNGHADL